MYKWMSLFFALLVADIADVVFNRDTWEVRDLLAQSGQTVEQRRLT